MATLALNVVGNFFLPGIGGWLGSLAGSYIDNAFIMPALFGKHNEGPKVNDFQLTQASEGDPVRQCVGPVSKVGGEVIWMDQPKQITNNNSAGGKGGATNTTYTYTVNIAVAVCEGQVNRILRILADSKEIYNVCNLALHNSRFRVTPYRGTDDQLPDPIIQGIEGILGTPAYRGTCYFVVHNMPLEDFGNRIPQFTIEVEEQVTLSSGYYITRFAQRAGLLDSQVDVTSATGCIYGYQLGGPTKGTEAINPILQVFGLLTQDVGNKLVFFPRGQEEHITVAEADLGASDSSNPPKSFQLTDADPVTLPSTIAINYLDPDLNYQKGGQQVNMSQSPAIVNNTYLYNIGQVDVPFAINAEDAYEAALRILWLAQSDRVKGDVFLPPSYYRALEGDILDITYLGNSYSLLITEVEKGANGVLHFSGYVEEVDAANQTAPVIDENLAAGDPPDVIQTAVLQILDLPALTTVSAGSVPGYCFAITGTGLTNWPGAAVFSSPDDVTFTQAYTVTPLAIMGYVVSDPLPDGPVGYWDYESTVDVAIYGAGSLDSVNPDDVLNGSNQMVIGSEIIGFLNADLVPTEDFANEGSNVYRLSGLLRGLRDTGQYTATHAAGDNVLLIDSNSVGFQSINLADVGSTEYFVPVLPGQSPDGAAAQSITFAGNNLKPFSPCFIKGSRDGSNNLTITWVRRTRNIVAIFNMNAIPLDEDTEAYSVDIMSGASVVRTINSITSPTTTYSATNQTSDGFTPGDPITVRVYQISAQVGRGNKGEETV